MNLPNIEDSPNAPLLLTALDAAVPLWMIRVAKMEPEERSQRAELLGRIIGEKGDVILFKSKNKGESAAAFNALAEGLAICAFTPGGVKFGGRHWEAENNPMLKLLTA